MQTASEASYNSLSGRDYVGQVTKDVDGETYILIGNEQQLRAIGSNKHVVGKVWHRASLLSKWKVEYEGDADIAPGDELSDTDYNAGLIGGILGGDYCGVDASGEMDKDASPNTGLNYTSSANYIIFRDIDVSAGGTWTPLMYEGTMVGAKAEGDGTLWNDDASAIEATAAPRISGVNVKVEGTLDTSEFSGVGFIGTLSSPMNLSSIGTSGGTASVKNIDLVAPQVNNAATGFADTPDSVVDLLVSLLGNLLGGILDAVSYIVTLLTDTITAGNGISLNLGDVVKGLLGLRNDDPTTMATGSFAGRVVGDARIENCRVVAADDGAAATVSSVAGMTGGFVGYAEGMTEYDGLSKVLGFTVDALETILNAIPGLGLGDLIELLLDENVLNVSQLIPTGYKNPVISGCSVALAKDVVIGSAETDKNGGFIGEQVGTVIVDSRVETPVTVQARLYAGGFSGVARNGVMDGLLTDLGVELVRVAQPQSVTQGCSTAGATVAAGSYAGGFTGALANSYSVNDTVSGAVDVRATGYTEGEGDDAKSYALAGGFAGAASLGWASDLGEREGTSDRNLIGLVGDLLLGLLQGGSADAGKADALLTLVGIDESAILGAQVTGGTVGVSSSGDYAGGLVGRGDGAIIAASDDTHCTKLHIYDRSDGLLSKPDARGTAIDGLSSVHADGTRAAGVIGQAGVASVGGLLNTTIGVGGYLPFEVADVTVAGVESGAAITAGKAYAGGVAAEATGGSFENVVLKNLGTVEASTRAGGFAGVMGPGSLADGAGLDLLGLGALKIDGLLAVGEGVNVTASDCSVAGVADGFTVRATAEVNTDAGAAASTAAGFVAENHSAQLANCTVENLGRVDADMDNGTAGGFVGNSETGGLADVADDASILKLGSIAGLLSAVAYLIPSYTNCSVRYTGEATVAADEAGGFAGILRSGVVTGSAESPWAVYNIKAVEGGSYAGGFGGLVTSGALASAADGGGGLTILGGISGLAVNLSDLLSLVDAYVVTVEHAGVHTRQAGEDGAQTAEGFTVRANRIDASDTNSGAAGGFAGYASGAQISNCDVQSLAHAGVVDPADGSLEVDAIDAYYDKATPWSVDGMRYAGGFAGRLDIGSTASVGDGLSILGSTIQLTDLLSALNVVVSTVEHSDVYGVAGGYAVRATDTEGLQGYAGGFAGRITGAHIQDSSAHNFSHVVGRIAAGGYAGGMEPGDVAEVLGGDSETSILKKLANIDSLANVLESFVPTVRNSSTDSIPCGGVVRAQAESDGTTRRGMAGGYAGYNEGGQIWGNDARDWKAEPYAGPTKVASADRIRSVFGTEVAGGYTGFMCSADTADTGSLSLLFGLIKVDTLASALSVVYPTQRETSVTGPLANLDWETWNSWVEYVGIHGGYGADLAGHGTVSSQEELDAILANYVFGTNVVAGRSVYSAGANACDGGVAGGYVGLMRSGVVSDGTARDTKVVRAMRAAGGYAGVMEAGGAAQLGGVSILGLDLNLGQLLGAVQVFVPTVQGASSVVGYRDGMRVGATGTDFEHECGHAGGYVGYATGAQIWGDEGAAEGVELTGCNVENLRLVKGTNTVGGYAGTLGAGSAVDVNTHASNGLLQGVLDHLIGQPGDLANVLQATTSTVRHAKVCAADEAWGYVVDGSYAKEGAVAYATAAGGFVGAAEAAVLGNEDGSHALDVLNVRGVSGGEHAGGFVGLADVTSVANVGGSDAGESKTSLLHLIGLGNTSVLDAFRTYIYSAAVTGVEDGMQVRANTPAKTGTMDSTRFFGNAGGFAGSLLNASTKSCAARNLGTVDAPSYAGGFAGYMGKNGTVDVDEADAGVGQIFELLGAQAGVLDVWGAHAEHCNVEGIEAGYAVTSAHDARQDGSLDKTDAAQRIAGGFVGLGDLSKIEGCQVEHIGLVRSDQVAGGFIGQTDMAYVAEAQISSPLLELLLSIVNQLVKLLYVDDLEHLGVIDLGGISGLSELLELKVLADGDALYVNLLGLRVSVALSKASGDDPEQTDVAIITIGDSTIKLPCTEGGLAGSADEQKANIEVTLIKGNRTAVRACAVKGAASGYDVFGGGATQTQDGAALEGGMPSNPNLPSDAAGYAGGFVGHNKEGLFENNTMRYCDTVRGTSGLVGPFSGVTNLKSVYFDGAKSIEGRDAEGAYNRYAIYRSADETLTGAYTAGGTQFAGMELDEGSGASYDRYDVNHYGDTDGARGISDFEQLRDAYRGDGADKRAALDAYVSPAKAVLMDDAAYTPPSGGITPEPGDGQDPCAATVDITLQKVWQDHANQGNTRPERVTFILKRSYVDASGATVVDGSFDGDGKMEVVLTAADDASEWSETWRKVVSGLPVAFEDASIDPPTVRYYTYFVDEVTVGDYTASTDYSYTVTQDGTGYVITVTNTLPLPDTGGAGTRLLTAFALAAIAAGGLWLARRRLRGAPR